MNETGLFHEEEEIVRAAEGLLLSERLSEISWPTRYRELLSRYRKLLSHTKRLVNVGDLMQKDLSSKNEQLKSSQEREERLREQLLQSQKMEAIGTLTGGIAHDFNNLLQVVLGYSELLLLSRDYDDPARDELHRIIGSARQGAELVQKLLIFSKKAESKPQPVDINRRIEQTIELLERTLPKMIHIETVLAPDLRRVRADPAQIDQVLMNLAINAHEAMLDGGRLAFETRNVVLDEAFCVRHHGTGPGNYCVIIVSDTGRGMDSVLEQRIFDPFFSTKERGEQRGTGLGLAVVLGIIEAHGGCIECASKAGKGTTFSVYLPALADEPLPEVRKPNEATEGGTETILLVDDEDLVRQLGEEILAKSGYTVLTAANGKEALDVYNQNGDRIDLVILDLIMPELSGKQCLEEILKINPDARILISTGYSPDDPTRKVIEAGARGHVSKPYTLKQMLGVVRDVLNSV
jgi:two-component system, cell cycle sensor histidine kinase and response regulator CckA